MFYREKKHNSDQFLSKQLYFLSEYSEGSEKVGMTICPAGQKKLPRARHKMENDLVQSQSFVEDLFGSGNFDVFNHDRQSQLNSHHLSVTE